MYTFLAYAPNWGEISVTKTEEKKNRIEANNNEVSLNITN